MQSKSSAALVFISLLLLWVLLNDSFEADVLLVGLVAAAIISLAFPRGLAIFAEFRATPAAFMAAFQYTLYFIRALVIANLTVAALVISPSLPIRPGIVRVRTRLQSRMGRMLLANSITLTPGTLTVALEGPWLYIHWVQMVSADEQRATEEIVAGFERYLEVMYG